MSTSQCLHVTTSEAGTDSEGKRENHYYTVKEIINTVDIIAFYYFITTH